MKRRLIAAALCFNCIATVAVAQAPSPYLEEASPAGENYAVADYRFWTPPSVPSVRALLVLVPGSNGDGRNMAEDTVWQQFATKNKLAIVACHFKDKPHDQNFIEDYVQVSHGSGQALLDAIGKLATRSQHPELTTVPILLWGMSAGGQFDYEFAVWKPERVAAFVVNKGGIYYTALTPRETRNTPAILFTGGKDLESRRTTITGLFELNRRGGALWAIAEEPSAAHIVGRSRDLSMVFFEDVLRLRLADGGALKALSDSSGYVGDPHTQTIQAANVGKPPQYPTAWLPTERVAKAWQAVVSDRAIEP